MSLLSWIENRIEDLLTRLGHQEEQVFIAEVETQRQFPEEYTRRFTLQPLLEPDQVKGREEEQEAIRKAYRSWSAGGSALLIIGEPGSGMTSLLNAAFPDLPLTQWLADDRRIYGEDELRRLLAGPLGQPESATWEALRQAETESERPVVIFENIERLFLRQVGGYRLLELFLLLVNATRHRFFWVVTVSSYSYYYLNSVMRFSDHFRSSVRLAPLPDELIEAVILDRNRDYELIFLKPEEISRRLVRRLGRWDEPERQMQLQGQLLDQIISAAQGNISRAQLLWLRSVQRVDEKRAYVKSRKPPTVDSLDLEELFVLESIFQHTSLSAEAIEKIARQDDFNGALILDQLLDRGWLHTRQSRTGPVEFQINLLYLEELKKLLRDRLNRKLK